MHTYETSKGEFDAAKVALKEAEVAVGNSEKTLQAAGGDIKNVVKHTKQALDEQTAAEKTLADFRNGPQSIFQTISQMNKPLPARQLEPAEPEQAAEAEA